jgi:hypothetical protein
MTPGPWTYDPPFTVQIPAPEGMTAFRTFPDDAKAIAALPELVACLVAFVEHVDEAVNLGHTAAPRSFLCNQAVAALERAGIEVRRL